MIKIFSSENTFEYKTITELKRAIFVFKIFRLKNVSYVLQQVLKIALFLKIPIGWAVKPNVYGHFVGGKSLDGCQKVIHRMAKYQVESILDYSVEGGNSDEAIQNAIDETMKSVEFAGKHEHVPFAVFKPSAMTYEWVLSQENRENLPEEIEKFRIRLFQLFEHAVSLNIPILVDAEEVAWQALIDQIVEEGMQRFNKEKAIVFQTLQMYRVDRLAYLQRLLRDARKAEYFPGIKLVRGAYMEKERAIAKKMNRNSPIYPTKQDTDEAYNKALEICVENIDIVSIFNGTHNQESCKFLTDLIDEKQLDKRNKNIYFVQLYGMSDDLSFGLAKMGYRVAKYVPYGPVKHVMPYLMRRAEENSSVSEQASRELKILKEELKRRKSK
ncbi:MAG: proline dehydrogenase family protein [Bacteroidales bacterium]|jgi:proline dehydrogenase|nr:proline dehydrogenase family protein [Bacteroidales bacterium]